MASLTYEELHGCNNWDGLLEPLNPDLRNVILAYGDLASASERALNIIEGTKYSGYCQYGKSSFFKGVMLPWAESKYNVCSYIYATAHVDSPLAFLIHNKSRENSEFESNWMGYIAVSNDEYSKSIGRREICMVWRGTVRTYEWINDIKNAGPVPADLLLPPADGNIITSLISAIDHNHQPKVMEGWLIIYNTCNPNSPFVNTSARTQLLERIKDLLVKYKDEKISIMVVGHSLGGSLATVSAVDIAVNAATPDIKVSAFVFASPQVGNEAFKKKIEELPNLKVLSVKNVHDIIPKWPSKLMEWVDNKTHLMHIPKEVLEYVDVGIHFMIDSKKSPFFKEKGGLDISHALDFHNLEGMLHIVAGYDGKDQEFNWKSVEKRRCLALVNMRADLLKEKYQIPMHWWSEKHKGMVLNESGEWVLSPLDRDDHDLSPTVPTTKIYQV